jgi:hypothetical protein
VKIVPDTEQIKNTPTHVYDKIDLVDLQQKKGKLGLTDLGQYMWDFWWKRGTGTSFSQEFFNFPRPYPSIVVQYLPVYHLGAAKWAY